MEDNLAGVQPFPDHQKLGRAIIKCSSTQAVRKRVKRGTLERDKEADGRVYVYLDAVDDSLDDGQDEVPNPNNDALTSRLEDEIEFLRDQVRRQQEIIAQQAVTMRQLSAPAEPPESPETASEDSGKGDDVASEREGSGGSRSLWRRIFGGE